MNQELCVNIVNNTTEEPFLFKTDHMIVNTNLYPEAITGLTSYAKLKRSKTATKTVINYDNVTDQQWESFQQVQDDIIVERQLSQYDLSTYNSINANWNEIQKCFTNGKKELPVKTVKNQSRIPNLFKNSECYKDLINIRKIIQFLTTLSKNNNAPLISDLRTKHTQSIIKIQNRLDYTFSWPTCRDFNDRSIISPTINKLKRIRDELAIEYKLLIDNYNKESIKKFVQERCENYETNKKKMINSIVDKEFKMVYIDRLISKDDNGNDILVTDPKEINKLTINHFQNIAGNKNSSKNIPNDWIDQYKPKDNINEHIYDQLCSIISETEVLEAINSLPNGKAVGPSGISYEMLKN